MSGCAFHQLRVGDLGLMACVMCLSDGCEVRGCVCDMVMVMVMVMCVMW